MPIIVKDETANAVILTIDNAGNICFGDGTPVNRLTLDGYGIIDDNGLIVHGATSSSVQPTEGSITVGFEKIATITTIAGRTPTTQLDTSYPAQSYDEKPLGEGGTEFTSNPLNLPVHSMMALAPGSFSIRNNTQASESAQADPSFESAVDGSATCDYRWL